MSEEHYEAMNMCQWNYESADVFILQYELYNLPDEHKLYRQSYVNLEKIINDALKN